MSENLLPPVIPNHNMLALTDLERRAGEIYTRLHMYAGYTNGYTSLMGLNAATTYLPKSKSYLKLNDYPFREAGVDHYLKLGFSREQIAHGVTLIQCSGAIYEDPVNRLGYPNLNGENPKRTYVAKAGEDKLIVIDEIEAGKGESRELNPDEALAMGTMGDLRQIVHEIGDDYGGYDQFDKALRKTEPVWDETGINTSDARGVMLFHGGLRQFVDRYLAEKLKAPSS